MAGQIAVEFRRRTALPAGGEACQFIETLRPSLRLPKIRSETWRSLRGPVAFGILRPTIALPPDFSDRFGDVEKRVMLAHEFEHLAARDPFWAILGDFVVALAWWNPVLWWSRIKLDIATEEAADEASRLIPGGPWALAECLIRFGREMAGTGVVRATGIGGNGSKSRLARRVERLLLQTDRCRPVRRWIRWMALGLASTLALATAAFPVQSEFSLLLAFAANAAAAAPMASAAPKVALERTTAAANAVGALDTNTEVTLKVKLVTVPEDNSAGVGLDWLFGKSATNDSVLETSHDWMKMARWISRTNHSAGSSQDDFTNYGIRSQFLTNLNNVTLDQGRVEGQSALLSSNQFAALLKSIDQKTGCQILTSPTIILYSGREGRVLVSDVSAIVTGMNATLNPPRITYTTAPFDTGYTVDVFPNVDKSGLCQLKVNASYNSFLGFENAGMPMKAYKAPGGKPAFGVAPQPHFRDLESSATASLSRTQTLAIRGPQWSETTTNQTRNLRLYVFVTPEITRNDPKKAD